MNDNKILNRQDLLKKAVHDCYVEMYAKAQPMADYDNLLEEYRSGKITKEDEIYNRHYLSFDEYKYIIDKYIDIYRLEPQWESDIEVLEEYLTKGGIKDKYIDAHRDKNGNYHPGYRGYEDVAPLRNHIKEILKNEYGENWYLFADEKAGKITDKVMELIKECKKFYKFDREEQEFRLAMAMGATPTQSADIVKEWWKENYDVDIEIEERNPKLFWYLDNGYTDEDLAYEFEEYGENWKEALDKEWKEEVDEKKRKREEDLKRLQENINKQIKNDKE